MKAAVLREIGKPYVIEDLPTPTIGPDEVLIETRTCGICRTDIHVQDGLAYVPKLPHVSGHEPAGVVAELGKDVRGFAVGDRVTIHLFLCEGDDLRCDPRHAPSDTLQGIIGVTTHGGFAEYFKAPAKNLLKLPDNVSFRDGGLVGCAIITAVHAYHRSCAEAGETAAVIGAGGIGIVMIQILKANGLRVMAIGRSQESCKLAMEHGVDLAVTPDAAKDEALNFTDGKKLDLAVDMVGSTSTMQTASDILGTRGRLVMVGEEDECPPINTIELAQRELEIIGSRNGGFDDAKQALQLISQGIIRPQIDREVSLDQINEAIVAVREGRVHGRVIVNMKE